MATSPSASRQSHAGEPSAPEIPLETTADGTVTGSSPEGASAAVAPETTTATLTAGGAMTLPPVSRRKLDTFGALVRHRNFRIYWFGALGSNIGTWMQTVAQAWLVYQLTGSAAMLGTVGFVQAVPAIFLSLVGGVLADRVERRTLMLATQTVAMWLAFLLGFLTLMHRVHIAHVIVIAFLAGIVNALNMPVRQGIISDLVPREDLQNAVAVNSAQFQTSRLLGPALAGVVLATFGPAWCFLLNGFSFLAVLVSLMVLDLPARTGGKPRGSMLSQAKAGIVYVTRQPPLGTLMLIAAVPAMFGMPYNTLMPIFAERILHVGARGLGLLMSAAGLGALLGALLVASLTGFHARGKLQLTCAVVFGLMLVAFGISHNMVVSLILLVVAGATSMTYGSLNQTFIQTLAADEMRGRVLSVLTLTTFGVMPLGNLIGGLAAQRFGAPSVLIVGGLVCSVFAGTLMVAGSSVMDLE